MITSIRNMFMWIRLHLYLLCLPLCTQRWGHACLPLSAQCVCRILTVWPHKGGLKPYSFHFCPAVQPFFIVQAEAVEIAQENRRRWPNAGLMLTHRLWRWANISPVLSYCVVFSATLHMGQRHRWRVNIYQALVQSIVPIPPAWSTD